MSSNERWACVKRVSNGYRDRPISRHKEDGTPVPVQEQAQEFANYLSEKHWREPPQYPQEDRQPLRPEAYPPEGGFTGEELTDVLRTLKNRKVSGVDNLPAELLRWLEGEGKGLLLEVLNKIFNTGAFPEEWNRAGFVDI